MDEEKEKKIRKAKVKKILDRFAGFIIATVFAVCVIGLGVVYVCTKGPSQSLQETFTRTFNETRRFKFVPHLFLTDEEVSQYDNYLDTWYSAAGTDVDTSLVTISTDEIDPNGTDQYGLQYTDGVNYSEIRYKGSTFYMLTILDPTRVYVGMPEAFGGHGLVLEDMVEYNGALGGINGGAFLDYGGGGEGGNPAGITIIDYTCYNEETTGSVAGLTEDGTLYVGWYEYPECKALNFKYAVSFNPVLIINGNEVGEDSLEGGINPRSAIGQRSDGAIVMICVDGRQAYSIGVSQKDVADFMLSYGVVNAINMDGGSSSCIYYGGQVVNHPSGAAGGTRYLPTAWLYR